MLINEKYLRNLIRQTLLNEAIYRQKDLNALSPELTNIISSHFEEINPKFSLSNEKSPGRFFIDVLYYCMEELLNKFDPIADPENQDFKNKVEDICFYISMLFFQKEVKSSTVQTGESFNEYIYNFMLKPKDVIIKDDEGNPVTEMVRRLKFVYDNVMYRAKVSGIERIMLFKQIIKKKETYYPFGNKLIDNKYLVVCPLSTMSSIFWARTNYLAKDIVLPKQDDIGWCTARFEGANLFSGFFKGGGTNLYYFLPKNDDKGKNKFCIGLTKRIYENKEVITIGGYTTVNFENKIILHKERVIDEFSLKTVSDELKVSMETLYELIKKMEEKDPLDKYLYTSLIDIDQFISVTNLDNIAPIDIYTKRRNAEGLDNVSAQINSILSTYNDPEYIEKGYKKDQKIINYVAKKWEEWKKEGVKVKEENKPEEVTIKKYKDLSLLSIDDFISITDLNNAQASKSEISEKINNILDLYINPDYIKKGFKPNSDVLNYIEKEWYNLKKEGIEIKEIHRPEDVKIKDYTDLSLLSVDDFISITGLNNTQIPKSQISEKINKILDTYNDSDYIKKGFKPSSGVLNYIAKEWDEWKYKGIEIKEKYEPKKYHFDEVEEAINLIKKSSVTWVISEIKKELFDDIRLIKEIFFQFLKGRSYENHNYLFNKMNEVYDYIKQSSVFDDFKKVNELLYLIKNANLSKGKKEKMAIMCFVYSLLSDTLKKNIEIIGKVVELDKFYPKDNIESIAIYILNIDYPGLKDFFTNNPKITKTFIKEAITAKYNLGLINEIDPQSAYNVVQAAPGQDIFGLENPLIPANGITKNLILDIINTNPKVFYAIYPNTKDFKYDDDIIMAVLKSHENKLLDLLVFVKKYYGNVNKDYSLFARILKEIPGSSQILYDYCIDNLKNRHAIIDYSDLVETAYYIYSASSNSDAVLNRYFGNEIAQQLKKEIMRIINPDSQNYLGKGVVDFFGSLLHGSSSDKSKNNIKTTKGTEVNPAKLKGDIEKISEKGKTIDLNLEHFKKRNNKLIMTESELRRLISQFL